MELTGARCLVTGASSGIGRATVLRLADAGADVLALGRDRDALAATGAAPVRRARAAAPAAGAEPIVCDLVAHGAIDEAVAAAGPIDVLVNNAGIGWSG